MNISTISELLKILMNIFYICNFMTFRLKLDMLRKVPLWI